ncbi:MAG: hypothetical protein HYZ29_06290 [Myxococcales bacterium]|nr:hypothetical protein [Myxococcales bacterium]
MPYLHHLLVQFPIALAWLAAVSSLAAFRGNERWRWLGQLAAFSAVAVAVLVAATGLLSAAHVIEMGGDPAQIARHRNLALGATGVLAVSALSMRFSKRAAPAIVAAVLAVAAVSVAAHFGGEMLHPGLAPWSAARHHHGPFSPTSDERHRASPAESREQPGPAMSAAAPPGGSSVAPAPSAPPKAAHDHSTHKH